MVTAEQLRRPRIVGVVVEQLIANAFKARAEADIQYGFVAAIVVPS
jgi:hypothetical protein